MSKYFCENLVLNKEALRMAYICKKTNKVCPRVKYGARGEASPDVLFTLKGCELLKEIKVEKPVEVIKQDIEKVVKVIEKEVVEAPEQIEQTEETKDIVEEIKPVQKQNNYKKKNRQYNKQNQEHNK